MIREFFFVVGVYATSRVVAKLGDLAIAWWENRVSVERFKRHVALSTEKCQRCGRPLCTHVVIPGPASGAYAQCSSDLN